MGQALAVALVFPRPGEREELVFDRLYRECRDDVYAFVAGLLRDRSAAEEVTAQAFERAYRKRDSFNPQRGSARAWLFGIARNAALDELRRRGRNAALVSDPVDETAAHGEDVAEAALRRRAVAAAIRSLNGRDRELVALKFFAGLDNAEIARVVGITESNVGTRLHRALEKLRKEVDDG